MTAGESKLKSIDLSNNDISTGGSTFIADFLATNPVLERLFLENNQLDDKDAKSIAVALKHNTNLRVLDIIGNGNITNSGWDALRKAEFDSTSLNAASDSNHTCSILTDYHEGMNGDPDTWNESPRTHFVPAAVRQKKIYSILSSRNRECSNVQHFSDVPVEFLPDMLGSIQEYSDYHAGDKAPPKHDEDYVEALSVVYEIMRFWNEAFSVYEALGSAR
jgi:hypothetical protein